MRKLVYILGLLILTNVSCAESSSISAKKKKKTEVSELTESQLIQLKNNFFEANKEKMIGNDEKAVKYFLKCIEIDPRHAASYYEVSHLYAKAQRITKSITLMERAVELDPNNKWYQQSLAVLYETNKQYEQGAISRGKSFEISQELFENIRIQECYLCGKQNSAQHKNGIDRVDNSKGYIEGNIMSCCSGCNYLKRDYNLDIVFDKFQRIKEKNKTINRIGSC